MRDEWERESERKIAHSIGSIDSGEHSDDKKNIGNEGRKEVTDNREADERYEWIGIYTQLESLR